MGFYSGGHGWSIGVVSDGVGIDTFKANVEPAGTKDGVNTVFTTPENFVDGTLQVYWNGVRLHEDVAHDYTTSESGGVGTGFDTIVFAVPPNLEDHILLDYVAAA